MNWRRGKTERPRVLLVFPHVTGTVTANDAVFPFPFLSLTQVAALLPSDFEVRIVDERLTRITGREPVDIVFITTLTSNAYRGYELARRFRDRGIPVVLGGIHATVCPEEAAAHATSVVIGEAEGVLDALLADFARGRLAPFYRGERTFDLDRIPPPALNLLNWRHRFYLSPLQTSRGCPNDCDFCSVPRVCGRRLRMKSIAAVDRQLRRLARMRVRRLFVVDDNFTVNRERALELMERFRYHGFRWMGFANITVSEDERFLRAMRDSGCLSLFIGFESLNGQDHLLKNRAFRHPAAMREAVDRIHAHHIGIQGSFIFGFDEDTVDVFQQTVAFIQQTGIELPNVCILTPFPGTPLFDTLRDQNRLLHRQWDQYDMNHVVFEPRGMSAAELQQGFAWALKYLAAPRSILARLDRRFGSMSYFLVANFSLHWSQTRLARSLWNPTVQSSLQKRRLCLC